MRDDERRLKKLHTELEPREIFLLWLNEVQEFPSMEDYVRRLMKQPDSSYPLVKMPQMVKDAAEEALKGRSREEIFAAIRRGERDILFLYFLHQAVNQEVSGRQNELRLRAVLLAERLYRLLAELELSRDLAHSIQEISASLPYPLDPETAACVRAAKEHGVESWESFTDSDTVGFWVCAHCLREGKTPIPEEAYLVRRDEDSPLLDDEVRAEVRGSFPTDEAYHAFLAGENFSFGLADLTDDEFVARCDELEEAFRALVEEGQVAEARVVHLETVPLEYLREAPLVEGEWLDREVLGLA